MNKKIIFLYFLVCVMQIIILKAAPFARKNITTNDKVN